MVFLKSVIKSVLAPHPLYEFASIEGIEAIQIPNYKNATTALPSPIDNIENKLMRMATEYKKENKMVLAIACLRKANEIMPHSNIFWPPDEYYRLVEYLKEFRLFHDARMVEAELNLKFANPENKYNRLYSLHKNIFEKVLLNASKISADLIVASSHECTCKVCSMYQNRVYSISGTSKKYPKLPDQVFKYGGFHDGCRHSFYSFHDGISELFNKQNPVIFSNRPFIDERASTEKEEYNDKLIEKKIYIKDKEMYDFLWEQHPNLAPKSFNAYRRMKSQKTKTFMMIKGEMAKYGIDID